MYFPYRVGLKFNRKQLQFPKTLSCYFVLTGSSYGSQELDSGRQPWQQAPLPTKPSHWLSFFIVLWMQQMKQRGDWVQISPLKNTDHSPILEVDSGVSTKAAALSELRLQTVLPSKKEPVLTDN